MRSNRSEIAVAEYAEYRAATAGAPNVWGGPRTALSFLFAALPLLVLVSAVAGPAVLTNLLVGATLGLALVPLAVRVARAVEELWTRRAA